MLRSVAQTVGEVVTSHGAHHVAIALHGVRLSDAVDQYRVVGAGVAIRHQVVGIGEAGVEATAAIYVCAAVEQVERILVGDRMASRTECAGTEGQRQVVPGIRQVTVYRYFTRIFVPDEFRAVCRKFRYIGERIACHTVETHVVVAD